MGDAGALGDPFDVLLYLARTDEPVLMDLSQLRRTRRTVATRKGAALVKQAPPVAWQHINLYGRYEFRKPPEPVNVDEIVRELAEIRIGTDVALAP